MHRDNGVKDLLVSSFGHSIESKDSWCWVFFCNTQHTSNVRNRVVLDKSFGAAVDSKENKVVFEPIVNTEGLVSEFDLCILSIVAVSQARLLLVTGVASNQSLVNLLRHFFYFRLVIFLKLTKDCGLDCVEVLFVFSLGW